MRKWFLRICFVVFLFVSSIFLIGVNVIHSLFGIELFEKLSSNQLIILFLVVTLIVFIITFMAASIVFFLQRLTDSVMYNQLEAIRNQQYSNVKKSVDEIWYRPLLMIRLDTFFQETAKIAEIINSTFLFFLSCGLAAMYLALAATLINKNIMNSHKNNPIIFGNAQ